MNTTNRQIFSKAYLWIITVFAAVSAYIVYSLTERMTYMVPQEPVVWVRYPKEKNIQLVPDVLKDVHTMVCLGDSITRGGRDGGYVGVVQHYIGAVLPEQKIEIINAGVDGDTTRNLLNRIDKDVFAHNPQLITVLVGVNDIARVSASESCRNWTSWSPARRIHCKHQIDHFSGKRSSCKNHFDFSGFDS